MLKAFERKISNLVPNNWFAYTMLVASIILVIPLLMFFQTNLNNFSIVHTITFILIFILQILNFYIAFRHIKHRNNMPEMLIKITFIGSGILLILATIANVLLISDPFFYQAGNYQVTASFNYFYIFGFILPLAFSFRKPKNKGRLVKYGNNKYKVVY